MSDQWKPRDYRVFLRGFGNTKLRLYVGPELAPLHWFWAVLNINATDPPEVIAQGIAPYSDRAKRHAEAAAEVWLGRKP